ncbi:hypothetical protein C0992_012845 [Termitomyces sp. T32_za158]|nr:hypothetical protein C0992_012845 [Termitomyces sp. T32_za158]
MLQNQLFEVQKADKRNPHVEYVLRYVPPKRDQRVRNYLSGYGVALNLKKTDYLAIDDRNTRSGANGRDAVEQETIVTEDPIISLLQSHPENVTAPSTKTTLTEEECLNLSPQAIQLIADSSAPMQTLKHLTSNFPKYVFTLARRVVVNESVSNEIYANGLKAQGGIHMFWLNGATVPDKDINPFGLLRLLKKERGLMKSLTGDVGLSRGEAFELLTSSDVAKSQVAGVLDGIVDASDRIEGGNVIIYWNDIEKDSRYEKWSTSIFALIRPMYHGIPSIKYNVFNVIVVLDLSQMDSLAFVAGNMAGLISKGIPLRFGVVPISETEDSTRMAMLFYHLVSKYGRKKTLKFIQNFTEAQPAEKTTVDWGILAHIFTEFAESERAETDDVASLEDILSGKAHPSAPLDKLQDYVERLDVRFEASVMGHVFFNGRHYNYDQVYSGKLTEAHNDTLGTYFYDQPTTGMRRNRYIYPTDAPESLKVFNLPELFSRTRFRVSPATFVYPVETPVIPLSLFVIADLDSQEGLKLVREALLSIGSNTRTRISFIHNPIDDPTERTDRPLASWLIAHLIKTQSLSKTSQEQLLHALGLSSSSSSDVYGTHAQIGLAQDEAMRTTKRAPLKVAEFSEMHFEEYVTASRLVARVLGIKPGKRALLVNGRIPDPSEVGLFQTPPRPRNKQYQLLDSRYTAFEAGDNSTALFQIAVIMDPLSVVGQRWLNLLEWLSNVPDTFIEIHLNPAHHIEDILRGHYQQLSADPNSLANLDQDLPNNLQREVPIFSLHEDWLWCETWCSKDRFHRAKTIDLCQNPLTKEPKLVRARQIPEWEEYDHEIAQFTRQLAEAGVIKSRLATADTNVLANAGTPISVIDNPSNFEFEGSPVSSSLLGRDEL